MVRNVYPAVQEFRDSSTSREWIYSLSNICSPPQLLTNSQHQKTKCFNKVWICQRINEDFWDFLAGHWQNPKISPLDIPKPLPGKEDSLNRRHTSTKTGGGDCEVLKIMIVERKLICMALPSAFALSLV